jgi:hypothetical protein
VGVRVDQAREHGAGLRARPPRRADVRQTAAVVDHDAARREHLARAREHEVGGDRADQLK